MVRRLASIMLPGKWLGVTVWGRNLFNEIVISQVNSAPTGFAAVYEFEPRRFGSTGRYRFRCHLRHLQAAALASSRPWKEKHR